MELRAKRVDRLQDKVREYENKLVVRYLNSRGYECNTSTASMIKANRKIKSEKRRVVIERKDEKLSRLGSYYVWNGLLRIKLVDILTGKEV